MGERSEPSMAFNKTIALGSWRATKAAKSEGWKTYKKVNLSVRAMAR